jgi:hypothetical protein
MSYLDDSTLFRDVVIPESHNAGAVGCQLLGLIHLNFLDCQCGSFYDQLCHGVRAFDMRLGTWRNEIFMYHGTGRGLKLEDALRDIHRFRSENPTEFVILGVCRGSVDRDKLRALLNRYLEPPKYCFKRDCQFDQAAIGDLRALGKNFLYLDDCLPEYCVDWGRRGTWSKEFSFGRVSEGDKLYKHLWDILCREEGPFLLSLNRASGSSLLKENPIDYMRSDRRRFLSLIEQLKRNPDKLRKVNAISFDCASEDYVQCGHAILLNATKGLVNPEKLERFMDVLLSFLK